MPQGKKRVFGYLLLAMLWNHAVGLYAQKRILKSSEPYREYQKRMDSLYAYRIQQSYLDGHYIPADEREAVDSLIAALGPHNIRRIQKLSEQQVVRGLIGSVGRWIIVRWGLEEGSRLGHHMKEKYGVSFPIDIADFLLTAMYRKVHNRPVRWHEIAKKIRERRKALLTKRLQSQNPVLTDSLILPNDTSKHE